MWGRILAVCLLTFANSWLLSQQPLFLDQLRTGSSNLTGSIFALQCDSSGFLWIGTSEGLIKYDGHRFTRFLHKANDPNSLAENSIRSIFIDENQILWVGTYGGGVSRLDQRTGKFQNYTLSNSHSTRTMCGRVWYLLKAGSDILAGTEGGLFRYDPKVDQFLELWPTDHQLARSDFSAWTILAPNDKTSAWVDIDRQLFLYRSNSNELIVDSNDPEGHPLLAIKDIRHMCRDGNGDVYFTTYGSGSLFRFNASNNSIEEKQLPDLVKKSPEYWIGSKLFMAGTGKILFANRKESQFIFNWENNRCDSLFFVDGLNDQAINDLIFDLAFSPDGRLIIGTKDRLLIERRMSYPILHYPIGSDIAGQHILGLVSQGDSIVAITSTRLLSLKETGQLGTLYKVKDEFTREQTSETLRRVRSSRGRPPLILSNDGVYTWDNEDGERKCLFEFARVKGGFTYPQTVLEDGASRIWVASWNNGLLAIFPDGRHKLYRAETGHLPGNNLLSLAENPENGDIMAGFNAGNGVWRYDEQKDTFVPHLTESGRGESPALPCGVINDLLFLGRELWIGTHGCGLLKYVQDSGELSQYDLSMGLPGNYIYRLIPDQEGKGLIARSNHGVFHFDPENEQSTLYSGSFAQNEPLYISGLDMGADGKIWYHTNKEVIGIQPHTGIDPDLLPAPKITSVMVEDLELISRPNEIRLSHTQNTLQIQFSAMHLSAGENDIRYEYRLNEQAWTLNEGNPDLLLAGLGAGTYSLDLRYIDELGQTSAITHLAFTVLPPFYKTWWFLLLVLLFMASLSYWLIRSRYERRIREHKLRNSIAGDLHDDLGSTLSSIRIFSMAARSKLDQPEQAIQILDRISSSAGNTMEKMGDIVWSIHPTENDLADLADRIRNFGSEILGSAGIVSQYSFPDKELKLNLTARRNLLMISKEAINNAAKYSQAGKFEFRMSLNASGLGIEITDNGVGFEPQNVRSGHGMKTLATRTRDLGGQIDIRSGIGSGTQLSIHFPIARIRDGA